METVVSAGGGAAACLANPCGRRQAFSRASSDRRAPYFTTASAAGILRTAGVCWRPATGRRCSQKLALGRLVTCTRIASSGCLLVSSFVSRATALPALGASTGSRTTCSVEDLPENLQKIVKGFQMVPDATQRYKQLLYYASKLKPLAPEYHVQENKVVGCVSQVWVKPSLGEDGKVYFEADSDSQLTKGLAALLVEGLSGATPAQILRIQPDFIQLLGLSQKLTPSRNNGFLNMLLLMQKRTLALFMEQEKRRKTEESSSATPGGSPGVQSVESKGGDAEVAGTSNGSKEGPSGSSSSGTTRAAPVHRVNGNDGRPIYTGMKEKLEAGLSPVALEIEDESHQHAGHAGVHKGASETHFNVKIVSKAFDGMNVVKRHRAVYQLLQEEFANGLHALSLSTKTPEEAGVPDS